MKNVVTITLLLVLVSGCSIGFSFHIGSKSPSEGERNRARLGRLEIGMCRDGVIEIMGRPYKTEAYAETEYLLYCTDENAGGDAAYTRIALRAGKVTGWGRHCFEPEHE